MNQTSYSNKILCLVLILSTLETGCSLKSWTVFPSLGIRPERPGLIYSKDVEERCSKYALPPETSAATDCLDFFNVLEWGQELEHSYRSRARINEWALTFAGVLAVASVGALTGLAAFGAASSDAAKIIPIAGGFTSGVISFMDNKRRAKNYTEAANEIEKALSLAEQEIDGTPEKFKSARPKLHKAISDQEVLLETKRIELTESQQEIDQLKEKMKDMERKLEDALKK